VKYPKINIDGFNNSLLTFLVKPLMFDNLYRLILALWF